MSLVYKPNWDNAKEIGVKIDGAYDIVWGIDRNGIKGEMMPDGLVKNSHFIRINEMYGIGRLNEEPKYKSFKFYDAYYVFSHYYR